VRPRKPRLPEPLVAQLRIALGEGATLEDLAAVTGQPVQLLYSLRCGARKLTPAMADTFARALRVPVPVVRGLLLMSDRGAK
jgi:hypothetical protein